MTRKIKLSHTEVEVKLFLEVLGVYGILALALVGIYYLEPAITGFVTVTKELNYSDDINLEFSESAEYTWNLANPGNLKSVKVSGNMDDQGEARVYIENNGTRHLIFDSAQLVEKESGMFGITGFAVSEDEESGEEEEGEEIPINGTEIINDTIINETEIINQTTINETPIINESIEINETIINETTEKIININLDYGNNEFYDANNDGVESMDSIIDFSVKDSDFNWEVNEDKLCTRYEIYSAEGSESDFACFGNDDCCNLVDLESSRALWNETLYLSYGSYGSTTNNIVFAQVLYADYDLDTDAPYSDIAYSSWDNLTAKFLADIIEFEDICIDTCLFDSNASSYNLIVELDNTTLRIDEIKYLVEEKVTNNDPILIKNIENISLIENKNYTLDLSDYFDDEDGDGLVYSYNEMDNITINIENNFAYMKPDGGFTGSRFTFITASDSFGQVVSNVFKIEVIRGKVSEERFEIRDSEDNKLAVFDSFGNLEIKGNLTQDILADENDFIIKNIDDSLNLVVTNPEGNLQIRGSLNKNEGVLNPGPNSFVIKNKNGEVVAYVNSTGSLFLSGALAESVSFE
ncbi:MAG: hypothetical protein QF798_03335 [Candidatus Woesearchaeota archaeon]|nr:hypothetical protein [Candidatus Woesearchaeota archaeon]